MQDFISGGAIITASPDNGSTSFVQMLSGLLYNKGNTILYYNPSRTINRKFIKKFYPNVYNNVCFIVCSIEYLINYIHLIGDNFIFNYMIIDPGDILITNNQLILLKQLLDLYKCTLICTSQIRQMPVEGGKPYSTLDRLNKKYCQYGQPLFRYSIWIRNITEKHIILYNKYLEIYNYYKDKINFIDRHIIQYSREGQIVNEKDYY